MNHIERALKGNNYIPWYIVVILLTFLAQAIAWFIIQMGLKHFTSNSFDGFLFYIKEAITFMHNNVRLLTLMLPLALSLFVMLFLIKRFHKRSFAEVVNGTKSIRWERIRSGFLVWFLIIGASTAIEYIFFPDNFAFQFQLQEFIILVIISLIFIPLQTTFEEVLFRGYLAQGFGSLTQNRLIALLAPTLIFTFMHMANPEVATHGAIMFFNYLVMALIWGLVCILDDGIEIGIGMHAANNIFISLFTTTQGAAFETDAVFEVVEGNPYYTLISLAFTGLLAVCFFYKKYNWSLSILRKLRKEVEKPADDTAAIH